MKQIQGPGIGILDVISPSRIGKMDAQTAALKAGTATDIRTAQLANYTEALQSMQPATPPLPAAFTPQMALGQQANYGQALQSMQP